MRYLDEKILWYAEKEELSKKLANKSEQEIQTIIDQMDIIRLRSTERPKTNVLNRLMSVLLTLPLYMLCSVKWCFTGDFYLDSWEKKYKVLSWIIKIMGVRNGY